MTKKKNTSYLKPFLLASQVGINMVVATFVGLAMGYGLDSLFHTSPYLTLIFLFFGIIAGFIQLFRTAKREMEKNDQKDL